jgi:hypothetical protein
MKRVETKREYTEVNYEAVDGTIFQSQDECAMYEKSAKCAIKKHLADSALYHGDVDAVGGITNCPDNSIQVLVPKTDDDIIRINQYLSLMDEGCQLSKDAIGKVVLLTTAYDDDGAWVDYLDDMVAQMTGGKYELVEKKSE